jgi:uncharacterized membrane protein YoaK (UPF0700 family)
MAGYVDAYALLKYSVYASFMSGNTTQTGLLAGESRWQEAAHDFLPIPFFVLGVFVGTYVSEGHGRWSLGLRSLYLMVSGSLWLCVATTYWDGAAAIAIATASIAMGVMNTTITRVGSQPVSLGYVTGSLNNFARNLALAARGAVVTNAEGPWDTHSRRAWILLALWASFLMGALLGGKLTPQMEPWTLVPPAAFLLLIAIVGTANRSG